VIGVAALAGGGTALVLEFTRHATNAEAQAAATAEISSRWQRLPAGRILPAQLSFTDRTGLTVRIDRIGIAPTAACAPAADPAVAQALVSAGCVTMVRATYVDDTGTFVLTLGIAVMPSAAAARTAAAQVGSGTAAGIRAVSFPGTTASLFGDAQRQAFNFYYPAQAPYLYLAVGGFTDGRVRTAGAAEPGLNDLLDNIPYDLVTIMTQHGNACREQDIRC
jgi:hypothetical protein